METIAWFSAGVTSAVATKIALKKYDNVRIIYFHIESAHPDNERFIKECEEWFGQKIERVSGKYKDHFDVIEKTRYINGAAGARCTLELKKNLRFKVEKESNFERQIFGFEFAKREINRAVRFVEQYPDTKAEFPLIENGITKPRCHGIIENRGIELPAMYKLGFPNNNCIGCVKGGKGYWNLVREHFPEQFQKMSKLEESIGRSCIKEKPLKDLIPGEGHDQKIIIPDCGLFCEIEFADLIDDRTEEILKSKGGKV